MIDDLVQRLGNEISREMSGILVRHRDEVAAKLDAAKTLELNIKSNASDDIEVIMQMVRTEVAANASLSDLGLLREENRHQIE